MTSGRPRVTVACGLAGMVLGLTACAVTDPDGPAADDQESGSASATSQGPQERTGRPAPRGAMVEVTGVVESSPEDRCLSLSAPGRTWVLTGTVAGLAAGDRVTVRGRPDPDATTTCQRGPVLVVAEVERG